MSISKSLILVAEKAYRLNIEGWAMKQALEAYEAAKEQQTTECSECDTSERIHRTGGMDDEGSTPRRSVLDSLKVQGVEIKYVD